MPKLAGLFGPGVSAWSGSRGALGGGVLWVIEVHHLRARWLLQGELIIPDRVIHDQLVNGHPDGVFLLWALNLNHCWIADAGVIPVDLVGDFGSDFAGGVRSEEHTSELQSLRHLVC